MQNLTAVTTSTIERNNREDGRKSMLARYSPEQANLFKALSAQDWHDHHPKINDFMKSILSERDASRALDTVASWTRKWAGVVSRKGLTQFFAHGYAATDPLQGPGGFTAFMCRPKEAKTARSEEEKRSTLRSSTTRQSSSTPSRITSWLGPTTNWRSSSEPRWSCLKRSPAAKESRLRDTVTDSP
jgi:hypothetical protein